MTWSHLLHGLRAHPDTPPQDPWQEAVQANDLTQARRLVRSHQLPNPALYDRRRALDVLKGDPSKAAVVSLMWCHSPPATHAALLDAALTLGSLPVWRTALQAVGLTTVDASLVQRALVATDRPEGWAWMEAMDLAGLRWSPLLGVPWWTVRCPPPALARRWMDQGMPTRWQDGSGHERLWLHDALRAHPEQSAMQVAEWVGMCDQHRLPVDSTPRQAPWDTALRVLMHECPQAPLPVFELLRLCGCSLRTVDGQGQTLLHLLVDPARSPPPLALVTWLHQHDGAWLTAQPDAEGRTAADRLRSSDFDGPAWQDLRALLMPRLNSSRRPGP